MVKVAGGGGGGVSGEQLVMSSVWCVSSLLSSYGSDSLTLCLMNSHNLHTHTHTHTHHTVDLSSCDEDDGDIEEGEKNQR